MPEMALRHVRVRARHVGGAVTPYYEQDGITIYHGDSREVLPDVWFGIDLVLTDPPYGLGSANWRKAGTTKSRWRHGASEMAWDSEVANVDWLLTIAPKCIIWGGHLMGLPTSRGWLVWNKIIRNFSSGVCELAWTNLEIPIDAFDYSHGQLANEGKEHPTQKPVPLMEWCIRKSKCAGLVADPYMGSGSTLVAAKKHGAGAIGVEIEERYCEIAAKRLSQGVLALEASA
jgi:site-specific DNA-methyltransferase (adenine-specific)